QVPKVQQRMQQSSAATCVKSGRRWLRTSSRLRGLAKGFFPFTLTVFPGKREQERLPRLAVAATSAKSSRGWLRTSSRLRGLAKGFFPLTPALSPGERENRSPSLRGFGGSLTLPGVLKINTPCRSIRSTSFFGLQST